MMGLGRIRCRSLSRPNSSGTVFLASRRAMAEAEGRDGYRTMWMGLESFLLEEIWLFHLYTDF